jgi:cytochrome b subunit of formate dehydrogenase
LKLKEIGQQLCTCTWIEIMTGAGVTLYLLLAMHNYVLAALAAGLFAPLIGFHFVITMISKRDDLVRIKGIRRPDENQDSEIAIQKT